MAIIIPIDADVSGLTRKLSGATSSLGGFGKMAAFAAGAAAFGGLIATVKVGIDEFMQAEKVTAQTNAVLKSTGGIANVTKRQIDSLATSIMNKSGMDDEAVKSAENLLLTFTNVRNEAGKGNDVFNQATKITADLSVAFGKDLNSSAILVGKALNDPVKGLSALSRVGIQFSEDQKKVIKGLVESGDTMTAQKMILKELETQVGGSAAAYGDTLTGKLNIAKETFRNLAGDLVSNFMPAIATAATKVSNFLIEIMRAPTLKAKVEVITSTIGDAWDRIKSWWSTGERKELPSGVKLTPPGSKQIEDVAQSIKDSLDGQLKRIGNDLGYSMATAIFGGTKRGAQDQGKSAGSDFVKLFVVNTAAFDVGKKLASSIIDGFEKYFSEDGAKRGGGILDWWVKNIIGIALGPAYTVGTKIADKIAEGIHGGRSAKRDPIHAALTNVMKAEITQAFNDAVQSARLNLSTLSGTMSDLVSQIIGGRASTSNSTQAAAIRAQIRQRQTEQQRADLQQAVQDAKTDDDRRRATQNLQNFEDELQAQFYDQQQANEDEQVRQNQQNARKKFDDLIAAYNNGQIDLGTFKTNFDALLSQYTGAGAGADYGSEFGTAFAIQFRQTAAALLSQAGILSGTPLQIGPQVVNPSQAQATASTTAQNTADKQAHDDWQKDLDDLRARAKRLRDQIAGLRAGNPRLQRLNAQLDHLQGMISYQLANEPARGLASGGIVTGPRFLVGEGRFNEAVIPLGSPAASEMMRKAFSDAVSGGGDTVYNVTINAGIGADPTELGREVVKAIKTFERKNGPVFVSA